MLGTAARPASNKDRTIARASRKASTVASAVGTATTTRTTTRSVRYTGSYRTRSAALLAFSALTASTAVTGTFPVVAAMSTNSKPFIVDSHLHVWADSAESSSQFPYAVGQDPPDSLKDRASTSALLEQMDRHGVDGALIVQPINHKFDHSYVTNAMKTYPKRFKGMMLHDPSKSADDAVSTLEDLTLQGYVGVRFNPYLWPKIGDAQWSPMSEGAGLAVYRRCAELQMPVGVMCFQGLDLHYHDIVALLEASPETKMILDHFGFTKDESTFKQLLSLAKYPQVHVKISALFRLHDASPYERVRKERFEPLLEAYGADRLMFGTDFPFVLEQEPEKYGGTVSLVSSWMDGHDEDVRNAVMGGTAQKLFGSWA